MKYENNNLLANISLQNSKKCKVKEHSKVQNNQEIKELKLAKHQNQYEIVVSTDIIDLNILKSN
ncbi:27627_t:CDS:2 [Gigaspora margarita]|uniref:27627_t:CDS:1 n=1 Tax=Gigaspora margarita TaxID=4874 RepID=A0ABN7UWG9_GIGMA|nr:27627_t:CDS:2 [Gigaspora margarita]